MRRPRRRLEVSTFPFLAVLLCAMGSLILLLLVLDRRAKVAARQRAQEAAQSVLAERQAAQRAAAEEAAQRAADRAAERERRNLQAAALHAQLTHQQEEIGTKLHSVEEQKSQTARTVAVQRTRWRELLEVLGNQRQELAQAEKALAAKRGAAAEAQEMSESARKEALRMSTQLRGLEIVLEELKAARKREAQTYSLLPYRGKRGAGRRPLYVECTANGILFHPDRKALSRIATAGEIRAEVEARVKRQRESVLSQGGQPDARPYLLMLIRPDGIAAYYMTAAALQGKEIDFGYEFIDADWTLDFPEGDSAPPTQPWMIAHPTGAAPADPSAPTRKVVGLRPGQPADGETEGQRDGGTERRSDGGISSSSVPPSLRPSVSPSLPPLPGGTSAMRWQRSGSSPGGSSDLPPLPKTEGRRDGETEGQRDRGTISSSVSPSLRPSVSLSTPGGIPLPGRSGRGPGVPNPDGTLPGTPPPTPGGGDAPGQPDGVPRAQAVSAGGGPGSPAVFPFDRNRPGGAGTGGQPGTAAAGGQSGGSGPKEQSVAPTGGTQQPGTVANGQPGVPPTGGTPAAPANGGQTAAANAAPPGARPGGRSGAPGEQSDESDEPQGPNFGPDPLPGQSKRPYASGPRPMRLIGNRDWVIPVECRGDAVVLRNAGQKFSVASIANTPAEQNPLLLSLTQIIARRQASVRPGEPPYRPQVSFLIYPDGLKTYYLTFPALESLGIPLMRQKVEADPPHR